MFGYCDPLKVSAEYGIELVVRWCLKHDRGRDMSINAAFNNAMDGGHANLVPLLVDAGPCLDRSLSRISSRSPLPELVTHAILPMVYAEKPESYLNLREAADQGIYAHLYQGSPNVQQAWHSEQVRTLSKSPLSTRSESPKMQLSPQARDERGGQIGHEGAIVLLSYAEPRKRFRNPVYSSQMTHEGLRYLQSVHGWKMMKGSCHPRSVSYHFPSLRTSVAIIQEVSFLENGLDEL